MKETYYLNSLDSVRFAQVRECVVERHLAFENGKPALQVRIEPPIIGQEFNRSNNIDTLILAARHEGEPVSPIGKFPCFVHIAILQNVELDMGEYLNADELQVIAWGEIYRTYEDAENHIFD